MIAVADSGPLHYLILLNETELLHRFYGQVVIPEAVLRELTSDRTPQPVRDWLSQPPPWLLGGNEQ
jgi:predicted nucleic acid-binding protein